MKPGPFLFIALLTPSAFAASVSVPFSTNFDTYTPTGSGGTDVSALFEETNNGTANTFFVDAGAGNIVTRQTLGSASGTNNTAIAVTTSVASLVSGGGFEFQTTFTLDSISIGTSGIINTSLNALASSAGLGTGYRLNYTFSDGGSLVLSQNGATPGFTSIVTATNLAPVAGRTYTITFGGIYTSATTLNLYGSITDGTTTRTTSASDSSIPAGTDNFFGVRTAAGNSTTPSAAQLTTTAMSLIAVPEPSSAAMAVLAAGLLGLRRKRA